MNEVDPKNRLLYAFLTYIVLMDNNYDNDYDKDNDYERL